MICAVIVVLGVVWRVALQREIAGTGPAGGLWIRAKNELDCGATSALIFDN